MGLFSFLDSRKSLAKWAHDVFEQARVADPHLCVQDVIDFALSIRYRVVKPKPRELDVLIEGRKQIYDIFSFCHLIADAELLSHLSLEDQLQGLIEGSSIGQKTYSVIDQELNRLGHQRPSVMIRAMVSMYFENPNLAENVYGKNPDFRQIVEQLPKPS